MIYFLHMNLVNSTYAKGYPYELLRLKKDI